MSRLTERRPVFLTTEQWASVESMSEALGENRSAWIRRAVNSQLNSDYEQLHGSVEQDDYHKRLTEILQKK